MWFMLWVEPFLQVVWVYRLTSEIDPFQKKSTESIKVNFGNRKSEYESDKIHKKNFVIYIASDEKGSSFNKRW